MEVVFVMLFWGFLGWLVWNQVKGKRESSNKTIPYTGASAPSVPSEWEQKNARRNRFVQMYKDRDWKGMVSEFDGYDFKQHHESFSDYQGMAVAWWHLGNEGKAEQYIKLALEAYDARPSEAFVNMAILNSQSEKYEKALEWLLKSNPSQMRAEKNWSLFYRSMRVGAECFMKLGMIDEGITFLKQAPTSARILDHDLADVFEWLGQFYEQKGDFGKALKVYQKVVTVRYDKELNRKILDLNQLVYEQEAEREERRRKK